MGSLREDRRAGLQSLADVTALLQRVRSAHPTAGLYEAADLQWWWSQRPRSTDDVPQLFWFDDLDRPEAAVIATAWQTGIQLHPIVMPGSSPDWVAHVVERGLAHATATGFDAVALEVDADDAAMSEVLLGHEFAIESEGLIETWLAADDRPEISPLHPGYRLSSRLQTMHRPHHMIGRNHADVEARLRQTSLYRPDLDLVVHDIRGDVSAYGLFWYDPTTATGLVEPMRTEDAHQRRGLARHVLTTGLDRLARIGANRIKICYEPGNLASKHLYLSAGFEPDRRTVVYAGRTSGHTPVPGDPPRSPIRQTSHDIPGPELT